jgi:hypothetical protein
MIVEPRRRNAVLLQQAEIAEDEMAAIDQGRNAPAGQGPEVLRR